MKTTKKDYELFKKECQHWIDRFQLNEYRLHFEFGKVLDGCEALTRKQQNGNATIGLNIELETGHYSQTEHIKYLAKHEVLHLLLGKMSDLAQLRYIGEEELSNEEERLVRKLVNIIK